MLFTISCNYIRTRFSLSTDINNRLKADIEQTGSNAGKWNKISFADGTIDTTASIPLTGGTVTGSLGVTGNFTAANTVRRIESLSSDVTVTGTTTQTTMWSFTIPAGALGTTGSIEITTLWNSTALGQKTAVIKYGGNTVRNFGMGTTTASMLLSSWIISNGSTTVQKTTQVGQAIPKTTSTGALTTTTTNSEVDQTLLVLMTLGTSTESVTLNAGSFAVLYP